jgi:hypothetical protein
MSDELIMNLPSPIRTNMTMVEAFRQLTAEQQRTNALLALQTRVMLGFYSNDAAVILFSDELKEIMEQK